MHRKHFVLITKFSSENPDLINVGFGFLGTVRICTPRPYASRYRRGFWRNDSDRQHILGYANPNPKP